MPTQDTDQERIKECAGLLGLTGRVDAAALKAAYHRAMKKWHPDLHHGTSTMKLAEWNAKRINEAREFLAGLPLDTPIPGRSAARARRSAPAQQAKGSSGSSSFGDPAAVAYSLRSDLFSAVAYNEAARILYLKFRSGATYRYLRVPKSILGKFLRSRSKPLFAKNKIFYSFTYERC